MRFFLKLSEHSLTEYRRSELIEIMTENVLSQLLVGYYLQQILSEKYFIYGGRNLRHEYHIARQRIWLSFV